MATDSPLLRLPLEIRLEIYRHVVPSLICINPCKPRLQTPTLSASAIKVPVPPWFEHAALPLPCMAAVSASRAPVIPADPCRALYLTCRTIHNELSQFYHCSSVAHGIRMDFCSATCMLAYAVAAPANVLRRVQEVDVQMYGSAGKLGQGDGALDALKMHVDGFQERLEEARKAECASMPATTGSVTCSMALRQHERREESAVRARRQQDGLVRVSVMVAAAG